MQAQFTGPNGITPGNGTKRQFLSDGVKEYGEGLRMLETDNRKKLQDRNSIDAVHSNQIHIGHSNFMPNTFISSNGNDIMNSNGALHPNPNNLSSANNANSNSNSNTNANANVTSSTNTNHPKVEPGSHFAEFSNMLGQIQQNISLSGNNVNGNGNNMNNSPANSVTSPSMKSPVVRKTTARSTAAPTPSTSGSVQVNSIASSNINNTKKKPRKPRKNSTSVPATPKTPNNPATPTSMNTALNNKRGKRKAPSSATTPVIKEDGPSQLKSVTEATTVAQNGSTVLEEKNPSDGKKVRKLKSVKRASSSSEKGAEKDSKSNSQKPYPTPGQQNGVATQKTAMPGTEARNPSTNGFNINNDAQFLGEFNSSEQFFDFGLYSTEDTSEMLPDFWGDPVDRNELS